MPRFDELLTPKSLARSCLHSGLRIGDFTDSSECFDNQVMTLFSIAIEYVCSSTRDDSALTNQISSEIDVAKLKGIN